MTTINGSQAEFVGKRVVGYEVRPQLFAQDEERGCSIIWVEEVELMTEARKRGCNLRPLIERRWRWLDEKAAQWGDIFTIEGETR